MPPGAPREPFLAAIEICALIATQNLDRRPGALRSAVCLGAAIVLVSTGGALRPGLVPAGWGGTRAMPSGEIWGGNGPAAGALIELMADAA
jgi:hypothetical protein